MFSKSILFIFMTVTNQFVHSFLDSCGLDGLKVCDNTQEPVIYSDDLNLNFTIVKNCVFENCPYVMFNLIENPIEFHNLTFRNPRIVAQNSETLLCKADVLIILGTNNFRFKNISVEKYDGTGTEASGKLFCIAHHSAPELYYGIDNVIEKNNPPLLYDPDKISIIFETVNVMNNLGIVSIFEFQNTRVLIENSKFINNVPHSSCLTDQCSLMILIQSYIAVINGDFFGNRDIRGSAVFAKHTSYYYLENVLIEDCSLILKDTSKALVYKSHIKGSDYKSFSVQIQESKFHLFESIMESCPGGFIWSINGKFNAFKSVIDGRRIGNRTAGIVCMSSSFNFDGNTTVTNVFVENSSPVVVLGKSSFFSQDASFINNSGLDGGALNLGEISIVNLNGSFFHNNKAFGKGGAVYSLTSIASVNPSIFVHNMAKQGGALAMEGEASLVVHGMINFTSNQAETYGGAIYAGGNSLVYISHIAKFMNANNKGLRGSLIAFLEKSNMLASYGHPFYRDARSSLLVTDESVYSESNLLSSQFINQESKKLIKNFSSQPAFLRLLEPPPLSVVTLEMNQTLPKIRISGMDTFGNPIPLDYLQRLSVRVSEATGKYRISGNALKAIATYSDGIAIFENLVLENRYPGTFRIIIDALPGQLNPAFESHVDPKIYSFNVTYKPCDTKVSRFSSEKSKCLPIVVTDPSYRYLFGTLATIMVLVSCIGIGAGFIMRIFKDSYSKPSHSSLILASLGCMMGWISLAISALYPNSLSCVFSAWLSNLSFIVLLFSVILVVTKDFRHSPQSREFSMNSLEIQKFVWVWFYTSTFVLVCFLIAWSALNPPLFKDIPVQGSSAIWTDGCSKSSFSIIMTCSKMLFIMMAYVLIYSIESSAVIYGSLLYSWLTFLILDIVNQTTVSHENMSFALDQVVQIVPLFILLCVLVVNKIIMLNRQYDRSRPGSTIEIPLNTMNRSPSKSIRQNNEIKSRSQLTAYNTEIEKRR